MFIVPAETSRCFYEYDEVSFFFTNSPRNPVIVPHINSMGVFALCKPTQVGVTNLGPLIIFDELRALCDLGGLEDSHFHASSAALHQSTPPTKEKRSALKALFNIFHVTRPSSNLKKGTTGGIQYEEGATGGIQYEEGAIGGIQYEEGSIDSIQYEEGAVSVCPPTPRYVSVGYYQSCKILYDTARQGYTMSTLPTTPLYPPSTLEDEVFVEEDVLPVCTKTMYKRT